MYGKRRCGITRDDRVFIAGGRSYQVIGRIQKAAGGFNVLWCNYKYVGHAKTKAEAKVMLFNKAKHHPDGSIIGPKERINEKGQLI